MTPSTLSSPPPRAIRSRFENHYNAIAANYDTNAWYQLVTFLDNHDKRALPEFGAMLMTTPTASLSRWSSLHLAGHSVPLLRTEQAFRRHRRPEQP